MNVVLVPALFLLVGLVVYKKVIEPRRGEEKGNAKKAGAKAVKAPKEPKAAKAPRREKPRAMPTGSGRPGSVL
ncbi:MAG: hypothetical protein JO176_14615 [Acidimicrobiia bacterium]|nr:hypothetical protein [Acidimicrobiia bacterium]